jgi:predicted dehydrogenase
MKSPRLVVLFAAIAAVLQAAPFRLAIAGLDHGHVDGFLADALARSDVQIVGVYEPKPALAADYVSRLKFSPNLIYADLDQLLTAARPDAVAVFTSTYAHKEIVERCAAHRVDVMMEKPLAVSLEHARAMLRAAQEHGIKVIVNYETTWYPSHRALYALARDEAAIGALRKIVVRTGHQGPKEIGCSPAFLSWLTDPKLNGGGALMDFGCYGADLSTWLMSGERPRRVTAVTQQLKPEVYPRVDDDATIVLSYPSAQCVIQASWNWPIGRKDMDVYGVTGQIAVADRDHLQLRTQNGPAREITPPPLPPNLRDPLTNLIAVVRGELPVHPLASLETNLIVTEILDAARESAEQHRSIDLPDQPPWR